MKSKHLALLTLFGLLSIFMTSCGDDEVIVTIQANNLVVSIDENPTNGQVLGTIPGETNQGTLTYSISSQNPTGAFALDATTGQVTVADASLFNYEERTSLTATVLVVNGTLEEEVTATINLNNLSESAITIAVTNDDFKSNQLVRGDYSRIKFANTSSPFVMVDGYNSSLSYQLILTGVAYGESHTFDMSSAEESSATGVHDLSFSSATADLRSDYYYGEILEVETNERFQVKTNDGDRTRFVDTDASTYWGDIQIETIDWVQTDVISSRTDFRMRPTPSVASTAGKLYFYDQSFNVVDSIASSGASGSSQSGTTYWYSLKFRGLNGVDNLNLSNGDYKINFKAPGGKESPYIDIQFIKVE